MHMGHSHLSPSRRGRVREKKLLKLEGKHISFDYTSWLNIQVYCYQNVLCASEGGGTISCDTKAVSFPALGVGAAGSSLCPGCRGLTQLVQGPCCPTLEKQKNITHKEQQNSQTHHQIFFFCLKVPGNLW